MELLHYYCLDYSPTTQFNLTRIGTLGAMEVYDYKTFTGINAFVHEQTLDPATGIMTFKATGQLAHYKQVGTGPLNFVGQDTDSTLMVITLTPGVNGAHRTVTIRGYPAPADGGVVAHLAASFNADGAMDGKTYYNNFLRW